MQDVLVDVVDDGVEIYAGEGGDEGVVVARGDGEEGGDDGGEGELGGAAPVDDVEDAGVVGDADTGGGGGGRRRRGGGGPLGGGPGGGADVEDVDGRDA